MSPVARASSISDAGEPRGADEVAGSARNRSPQNVDVGPDPLEVGGGRWRDAGARGRRSPAGSSPMSPVGASCGATGVVGCACGRRAAGAGRPCTAAMVSERGSRAGSGAGRRRGAGGRSSSVASSQSGGCGGWIPRSRPVAGRRGPWLSAGRPRYGNDARKALSFAFTPSLVMFPLVSSENSASMTSSASLRPLRNPADVAELDGQRVRQEHVGDARSSGRRV